MVVALSLDQLRSDYIEAIIIADDMIESGNVIPRGQDSRFSTLLYKEPYPGKDDRDALILSKGYCEALYRTASKLVGSSLDIPAKVDAIMHHNIAGSMVDRSSDGIYVSRESMMGLVYMLLVFCVKANQRGQAKAVDSLIPFANQIRRAVHAVVKVNQADAADEEFLLDLEKSFDDLKSAPLPDPVYRRVKSDLAMLKQVRDRGSDLP
jgi:hypothetical protein